ncbi:hypothetical protein [Thioclava indica]|uniref:hypothetical protein n=1 Tax=Thioclava indica TaxID=1353528 RepID=UPI0012DDF64E|nr:hypothetical protein [Thioclava indica]
MPRIQLSAFNQGLSNRLNGMGMVCNELPGGGVCRVEEVSDARAQVFGHCQLMLGGDGRPEQIAAEERVSGHSSNRDARREGEVGLLRVAGSDRSVTECRQFSVPYATSSLRMR